MQRRFGLKIRNDNDNPTEGKKVRMFNIDVGVHGFKFVILKPIPFCIKCKEKRIPYTYRISLILCHKNINNTHDGRVPVLT